MMWGWPFSVWELVVKVSLWVAGATGVAAAMAAFTAGYVAYELGDAIQRESTERVADAGRAAAAANEAAGKANASAAAANERASVLEKEAASARLETAQIMKSTAWRQLQPNQIAILKAQFSKNPGKLTLEWIFNDPESIALAIQFSNVLRESGWSFGFIAQTFPTAVIWGVHIPDTEADETKSLREALTAAGISFSTDALPSGGGMSFQNAGPKTPAGAILLVGSKLPTLAQPPN